jgi:hypothetical protein
MSKVINNVNLKLVIREIRENLYDEVNILKYENDKVYRIDNWLFEGRYYRGLYNRLTSTVILVSTTEDLEVVDTISVGTFIGKFKSLSRTSLPIRLSLTQSILLDKKLLLRANNERYIYE